MTRSLPPHPTLEHLRKEAKVLLKAHREGDSGVCNVLRPLRRFAKATDREILSADVALNETQFALAMDYGFESWAALKLHVTSPSTHTFKERDYSQISLRGNGHSDDHLSLTFTAAAKLLGRDAPYEEVLPLSINPFAPAFYLPEACPSFWHQRGRVHGLDILARRFGIHYEQLQLPETNINPVSEAERFRAEYLAKCAGIFHEAMQRGCVIFVENGWAAAEGGPFVSWLWSGIVEEARADGTILGATLNGRHDNTIVDPGRCWSLSAGKADLDDKQAKRIALEQAVHRVRADQPPFESGERMAYGLAALDAWIEKMNRVPFCEACAESAPDSDHARGWSCARDCATSVCEGAAAASRASSNWASDFEPQAGQHLRAAGERYANIENLLRPFVTWEKGQGYHTMMGNLEKQQVHADGVLCPVRTELAAAADEMEKAMAAMK